MRAEFCRAPVLLPFPAGHCAHPLGRKRAGQRLGAEVHGFDFGRAAVCDVDLFEVIRKIDPKHQNFEKFGKVWNLCVVLFTVMMAAFSWLSDLAVFGKLPDSSNLVSILVCGGIGVLFIILGNFMPQIKQNYTFGCRTPWALNDEHNWQRTQRMGGYTFVVMGIVLLVLAFLGGLLGDIATLIVLLAAVLGGSAWIYLYSYLVYVGKMK